MKPSPSPTGDNHILKAVFKDGTLLEAVMNDENGITRLVSAEGKELRLVDSYTYSTTGITYYPMQDKGFINRKVILPILTEIDELRDLNVTSKDLIRDIQTFIHKYVDVDGTSEHLCALYCLNTWVFDKYEKVPYLRLIGMKETGKSRIKKILGSICYHTLDIGFGMTDAALFRSITKYQQGTVLIDEANLADSSIYSSLVKILNGGYEKGAKVYRCDQNANGYDPVSYEVYCPKIIANHTYYLDAALENRMHTIITLKTQRADIPESLSGTDYEIEANQLQKRLLAFRLLNFHSIDCQKHYPGIETYSHRLREITLPLLQTAGYETIPDPVRELLDRQVSDNCDLSANTPEGMVADAIYNLLGAGQDKVLVNVITSQVNQLNETNYSSRYIGETLKIMRIPKSRKSDGVQVDLSHIDKDELRKLYGLVG